MSVARTRISRAFIVVLSVTIFLGLVVYLHSRVVAPSEASRKPSAAEARPEPATQPAAGVLVMQTPSVAAPAPSPSTQPTLLAVFAPAAEPALAGSVSLHPLADGRQSFEAGRLLEARQTLNAAICGGQLNDADATAARQLLTQINQTVTLSARRFPDDPYGGSYVVKSGDRLSRIANNFDVTTDLLASLNGITDPAKIKAGASLKVIHGPFHAVVQKSKFNMDIYLGSPGEKGSLYVCSYPVGLGRDDSTPTGVWMVEPHKKLRHPTYYSPRGEGVIAADDPKNPLGPFWIGLAGINGHATGQSSYGIHGTIDPSSIGKQESLGCIRMRNQDVAQVFQLLVEGKSTVVVKD